MTQSSTIGAGHPRSTDGTTTDTTGSGNVQLSFNPMHPSMELPPEQLIRLLGVETKKTRKARHAHDAKHRDSNRSETKRNLAKQAPSPQNAEPATRSDRASSITRGPALWILTLITTLLAVMGVGAYLFLSGNPQQQAGTGAIQQQAADGESGPLRHQSPAKIAAIPESPASGSTNIKTTTTPGNGVNEQATIDAELLRLRHEAEQRFERRMAEREVHGDTVPEISNLSGLPSATANSGSGTGIAETGSIADEEVDVMPETAPAPVPAAIPGAYTPDIE